MFGLGVVRVEIGNPRRCLSRAIHCEIGDGMRCKEGSEMLCDSWRKMATRLCHANQLVQNFDENRMRLMVSKHKGHSREIGDTSFDDQVPEVTLYR